MTWSPYLGNSFPTPPSCWPFLTHFIILLSRFGIFLGISFNENADTLALALHGPIEVALGLSFGLGWGLLAQWIPAKDSPHCAFFR